MSSRAVATPSVPAPVDAQIASLPEGYTAVSTGGVQYYYYQGDYCGRPERKVRRGRPTCECHGPVRARRHHNHDRQWYAILRVWRHVLHRQEPGRRYRIPGGGENRRGIDCLARSRIIYVGADCKLPPCPVPGARFNGNRATLRRAEHRRPANEEVPTTWTHGARSGRAI